MYEQTTQGICVSVQPSFMETHSAPEDGRFVWAYSIRIENKGRQTVRLMTRHWEITDARGETHEVDGDGVIGEQPVIDPGNSFEYTSGAPLATPSGFMVGSYRMETDTGESIDVAIPAFSLDSPYLNTPIH
ncbi:MAG: Co2+/Mg2+ efflux protein ApaG [Rhodospirillales bacterium]|jgi:ApaG protein|nr:Co2+/Mg2+ efflux protein ApaG [Rhodospirillales bacterium]